MFKTDFTADEGRLAKGRKRRKAWPADCLWPEPVWDGRDGGMRWSADDADIMTLDEDAQDLLEIREYMDSLVEEGRLNEDYSLNEDLSPTIMIFQIMMKMMRRGILMRKKTGSLSRK